MPPSNVLTWDDVPLDELTGLVLEFLVNGGFYHGTIKSANLDSSNKLRFQLSNPQLLVHKGQWEEDIKAGSEWVACAEPTSLTIDPSKVLPERRRTHIFFRMTEINSANILDGGSLLQPETEGTVPEVPVTDLKLKCTYHTPAKRQCGDPATTAVLSAETGEIYFRCSKHRGLVHQAEPRPVRGPILQKVPQPPRPNH